jgi:ABC-2 type transport system ATP-binding protein
LVYDGKIESINEKLMDKKIIKLQTLDRIKPSENWKIRKMENGIYSLEVSREKTRTVISYLLNTYNIRDFSVEDIPLEESLEILYRAR